MKIKKVGMKKGGSHRGHNGLKSIYNSFDDK